MTATVKDDTKPTVATFSVKFEGCANTDELNFQVNLPLKFGMHCIIIVRIASL